MIELSTKRVEQILHEETQKTETLPTILRGVYTRYMRLYERYFADIDALNDGKIGELKQYHEETGSLVKCYYMDIPLDICTALKTFDAHYTDKLLGPEWNTYLFDCYQEFRDRNEDEYKCGACMKAAFTEQVLTAFYEAMDYIFRDGFGTGSQTAEKIIGGLRDLLFD